MAGPGTDTARWLLAPLPLLGVLLLALGGAWLLAGRRSERLAYAGSAPAPNGPWRAAPTVRASPKLTPRALAEVAVIAAVVVGAVFAVQAFVVKPVVIPSESMLPTLAVGEQVVMERVTLRFGEPERGDIVVFKPPAGAADKRCGVLRAADEACPRPTGGEADGLYIKRVVAEPGDRLRIVRGRVYIDGKLQSESQIRPAVACRACNLPREITIPAGHFFVIGDNRGGSVDSRDWGPVPRDQIIGRAVFSFWPPGRVGTP